MRNWINLFEKWDASVKLPCDMGHCDVFRNPSRSEFNKLMSEWNDQGRASFTKAGDVLVFDSDEAIHDWVAKHYEEVDREYPTAMIVGHPGNYFLMFHHFDRYESKWINDHILPAIRSNPHVRRMLGKVKIWVEYHDGHEADVTTADYEYRPEQEDDDA